MFFDIGWSELLVIGVVALVFIGPKDLPRALRVAGYWFRKARTLSREFQNSVDQMIREAEIGRASCRERVESWVGGVGVKKKRERERGGQESKIIDKDKGMAVR